MTDCIHDKFFIIAREVVEHTIRSLPEDLRQKAETIPVYYEIVPLPELVHDGIEADILGLFEGPTVAEDDGFTGETSARIILYIGNIFDEAGTTTAVFRDEVRVTYLHELGHYFGYDEDELSARDL